MREQLEARLEELRRHRVDASVKAGRLQAEMNQAVVEVHQFDGAIAAFEEVLKMEPAVKGDGQ